MIDLVRYHTNRRVVGGYESCVRSAFIKRGRKWIKVLAIDATAKGGLRLYQKVPLSEEAHMKPLLLKGKPYPHKRALKVFRRFAKVHGMTNGAKRLLKEATAQARAKKEDKN